MAIRFKSAGSDQFIVHLDTLGWNNEGREVVDPRFAKYRCGRARVLKIVHKRSGEEVNTISSNRDVRFLYSKGEECEEANFDPDPSVVCGKGIHYYLSEEAAYYHGNYPLYGDDGQMIAVIHWKDEMKDGEEEHFYSNCQMRGGINWQEWSDVIG